ncbi:ubiquinol-cytochrome C chaperone family protein [Maricaulis sp.]|uniref:ubiquinol-cytochrome C chaperone family protein n=1 Tax=Maricaulis sp. TaxID=1486257 RepID=UPI0026044A5B|nr:ubiquinol-cytochrome C chaperone family protein [Maricaulis sp.]
MFSKLFKKRPAKLRAETLYAATVQAARQPQLYGEAGVPDTLQGRFEMILLHATLLIHELRNGEDSQGNELAQEVFDVMFDDFDAGMRELGLGDSAVGKKIRFMAEDFYGRASAYVDSIAGKGEESLTAILARNVLECEPGDVRAEQLAAYVTRTASALAGQGQAELVGGAEPAFQPA